MSSPGCNALWLRWRQGALRPRRASAIPFVALLAVAASLASGAGGEKAPRSVADLRVSVLDVGQGDAILLQPRRGPALLVDGGPPGDDLAAMLRQAGLDALGGVVVTHDQSDHSGGVEELWGRLPIGRLLYARLDRRVREEATAVGADPVRLAAGDELRSGALRIEVLWPPRELLSEPLGGADPNSQALVLLVRLRGFSMLLTADAETEALPLDPGPVDVLKVAHHGSDDAGLDALLDRTVPKLAVISVGESNPYGHPTPGTLGDLAAHRVPVLRTDRDGTVVLEVDGGEVRVVG